MIIHCIRRFNVLEFVKYIFCDFMNIGSWFCPWFLWRLLELNATNSQSAAWYWNTLIERCSGFSEKPPQCNFWLFLRRFWSCDCLILLVVPATNAVSERSASVLRRLKTYLWTTMTQERWFSIFTRKRLTNKGRYWKSAFNIKWWDRENRFGKFDVN